MINYVSGGAHCCQDSYFINLGSYPDLVEVAPGDFEPIYATSVIPAGGLLFKFNEFRYGCWDMPPITLRFQDRRLVPALELMRKTPPSLATISLSAKSYRLKMGTDPFDGEEEGVDCTIYRTGEKPKVPFWYLLIQLLISDRAELAWHFLDLLWPENKPGKELFIKELKTKLADYAYWNQIKLETAQ